MQVKDLTLQELRLFTVYLSRINKNDRDTRFVHFHISELHEIFEIGDKVNKTYYENIASNLLSKKITMRNRDGSFIAFNLFSAISFGGKDKHDWYLKALEKLRDASEMLGDNVKRKVSKKMSKIPDMNEHDLYFTMVANFDTMPFLFDFKDNFFSYKLYNALNLKSKNQLRMYEILKEFAFKAERIVSVDELKSLLGIEDYEYLNYKDFKKRVLEPCKKAIDELTDISFIYEPYRRGAKGKILQLKFNITKKKNFKSPLSLKKFMDLSSDVIDAKSAELPNQLNLDDIDPDETEELLESGVISKRDDLLISLRSVMGDELTVKQVGILYDEVLKSEEVRGLASNFEKIMLHFASKYRVAKERHNHEPIRNLFGYMKKIISTK